MTQELVTAAQIQAARARLPHDVRLTPILPVTSIPEGTLGATLLIKAENLQITGSYKPRAAFHFISTLSPTQRERGIVLSSSGNFSQAFGYASSVTGTPVVIVMPTYTSPLKIEATRAYGAEVVFCEGFSDRELTVNLIAERRGMVPLNTFENNEVIIGHGTIGLEISEQVPGVDTVLVPISSGGLASGIAVAVKTALPHTRVIAVQPLQANAAHASWHAGEVQSITKWDSMADALSARRPGELPFRHLQAYLDDIVLVSEDEIAQAFTALLLQTKTLAEAGGAVAVAAYLAGRIQDPGLTVAVVSGGNTDRATAQRLLMKASQ